MVVYMVANIACRNLPRIYDLSDKLVLDIILAVCINIDIPPIP